MKNLTDIKQPFKRSEAETNIKKRRDRVGQYLKSYLDDFVFDELSEAFLEKTELKGIMNGVPIPLNKSDVEQFQEQGLETSKIANNMAWIMGIDPKFKYTEHYMAFLFKLYNVKVVESLLKEGNEAVANKNFDKACILFRACLCLNPSYLNGMYSYARVCREMYLEGGDEDYVGNFKAESIDYFELLTEAHPEFDQAYYYLGYAYLNLGLYIKADITWRQFLDKSNHAKDKQEIKERLHQLEAPVKIEEGCNDVLAGRYEEGIDKLQPYLNSQFKTWWPLSYYLGVSYSRVGDFIEAVKCLKNVLILNPSHIESMEELVEIYNVEQDKENEEKYSRKIELIKSQLLHS